MSAAHVAEGVVADEAVRLHAEIGWVDGTLTALRRARYEVTREQLIGWLTDAGIDAEVDRPLRLVRTGGRSARQGDGRLLSQEEFERAHAEFERAHAVRPLPDVRAYGAGGES